MPVTLDPTPGSPSANTYADLDEFNAYSASRFPQVAWFATATDDQKSSALIAACRELNACFQWTGRAVDGVQALSWPRAAMLSRQGYPIPLSGPTSIPIDLKNAQCEFALQLLAGDRLSDNVPLHKGITSIKAGSVALSFSDVVGRHQDPQAADVTVRKAQSDLNYVSDVVPDEVRRLLVDSWFIQNLVSLPLIFDAFGGPEGRGHGHY